MSDRHQQCIFYIVKNSVFKFCQYRENINGDQNTRNQKNRTCDQHDFPHKIIQVHSISQIRHEQKQNGQHDQPQNCRLAKIFTKRVKKILCDIPFLRAHSLHAGIIQRCSGSACCYDRQTTDQPQNMHDHQICDKIQCPHEQAVK